MGIFARRARWSRILPIMVAAALVIGTTSPASAGPGGFVKASGTELVLHGKPWRFVGFNDYQLTSAPGGYYYCGRQTDTTTLESVLRDATNKGATAIRT